MFNSFISFCLISGHLLRLIFPNIPIIHIMTLFLCATALDPCCCEPTLAIIKCSSLVLTAQNLSLYPVLPDGTIDFTPYLIMLYLIGVITDQKAMSSHCVIAVKGKLSLLISLLPQDFVLQASQYSMVPILILFLLSFLKLPAFSYLCRPFSLAVWTYPWH